MHTLETPEAQVCPLPTKLYYGSGATAFGIKDAGFNYFLLIYYNQVLGLDAFLTGLALALAIALDACSDLFVGYVSDRWRSSWGRRHPFMYAAAIPTAASFVLIWNPPTVVLGSPSGLFVYLLAMAVLVRTFLTFFEVPNAAQGPELTGDYDDRTRLMGFRYLFGWLGGLSMAALTYMVLFPLDPERQLGASGYQWLGIVGGSVMFMTMILSSVGTHHHIPSFYKPAPTERRSFRAAFEQYRGLFGNESFRAVFFSGLFFGAAAGLSQALNIYVSTYFWHLDSTEIGFIPLLGLIAVPLALLIVPRLSSTCGKKRAAMYAYLFAIAFLPIAYAAQLVGAFPEREDAIYLPLLMTNYLVETTAIIVMQILFASMSADVADDRSAETQGRRDEGLIFAMRNFAKKIVSGGGVMLAGAILWVTAFPEGAQPGATDGDAATGLVLVYLPVLIGLYLLSYRALDRYRIDRSRHEANLKTLAASAPRVTTRITAE